MLPAMVLSYLIDFRPANGYNLYRDMNFGNIAERGLYDGATHHAVFSCYGEGGKYDAGG